MLLLSAARPLFAFQPSFEISASSTNLIVTEQTAVTLRLRLAGLGDPFAAQPPFLSQRPPHVEAAFLAPGWSPGPLAPADPKQLFEGEARRRRDVPAFTLNNYVSNDIFSSMGDPFGMMDDDFFGRSMLGPRKTLFPFAAQRVKVDGKNVWEFSVTTAPYRAVAPGTVTIPPVRITIPLIFSVREGRDRLGRRAHVPELRETRLATRPLTIVVGGPPADGRPAAFCGAVSSNLSARATLDTNVCTAGDPLVFTLDVSGAADLASVYPPALGKLAKWDVFRVDEASVKTDTFSDSRRFTWRVRALKAGTVEFPSIPVAYYDLGKRAYVTVDTGKIPIQVKAGAQAALGALDETGDETDALPMPDGIGLDPQGAASRPFLPHLALSLLLFAVPPILFLVIRLAPPVRRRVAARNDAYRKATAFGRCRRALRGHDSGRRRAAIRAFFAVRYGVNGAAVTAADAERLMSPDYTAEEIAIVASALAELDRTEFAARKTVVSLLVLLAAVLGGAGVSVAAPASPVFTYRRASVLATRAADDAGFRAAADAYRDCLAAGSANPMLFTDLGTCALLAGDAKGAAAAFARA
ncbi:MAG: BatD family protein, partial [Kiritimatiellae bacterium]|nr:BatD family protein [Kiritimatiellia bacterium]